MSDTDGDGLRDDEETLVPTTDFGTGMDPWLADTDFDGLSDRFEFDDVAYGVDPNTPNDLDALPQPTVSCRIEAIERPTGLEPWRYRVVAQGDDPQSDLVELKVNYGTEVFALYQSAPTAQIAMSNSLDACYPNPASVVVTARDELGMEATASCVWGAGAPHTSDPCNGVDDDCDGVVDDGCPTAGGRLPLDRIVANWPWVADDDGGDVFDLPCDPGMVHTIVTFAGDFIDRVGAFCTQPGLSAPRHVEGREEYVYDVVIDGRNELFQTAGGHGADDRRSELTCENVADNAVVIGIYGGASDLVDRLGAHCATLTVERVDGTWQVVTHWVGSTGTRGGPTGDNYERFCPAGTVASKLTARAGTLVDNLSGDCSSYKVPITAAAP